MPPSYDLIIEEDGLLKTVEVWAVNKECAVSNGVGKKERSGESFLMKRTTTTTKTSICCERTGSTTRLLKTN